MDSFKIINWIIDFLKKNPNSKVRDIISGLKDERGQHLNRIEFKKILWKNDELQDKVEYNGTYSFKENSNSADEQFILNNKQLQNNNIVDNIDFNVIMNIINEEKYRLGRPDSNLLAENILYRIKEIINYESTKID